MTVPSHGQEQIPDTISDTPAGTQTVFWEAPPRNKQKEMQRLTLKYQAELKESYGNVERKIEGPKDRDFTGRLSESTILDPWVLPGTESPTKEKIQAGPRWHIHMQQMSRLVFMWVTQITGAGSVPESLACLPVCGSPEKDSNIWPQQGKICLEPQ